MVTPLQSPGHHFLAVYADSPDPIASLEWTTPFLEVADICTCV